MRGVDRRGTSGVERGGGHSTIVWGDDWNDKKIERKCGHGLKWPKLHGKMQQPAESQRSRWGILTEDIRNGIMAHLWGINLSHIYAREVRWYFEFNSWYSSKICSCLSKITWHNLHLFLFEMSTLKGDERVNIFHFTIHFFRPYVKIGEYRLKFVRRNVIF